MRHGGDRSDTRLAGGPRADRNRYLPPVATPQPRTTIQSGCSSAGSTWKSTRPRSRVSRNSAIAVREPIAIAPRSTGSRRSSRATAARTPSASSTTTSRPAGRGGTGAGARGQGAAGARGEGRGEGAAAAGGQRGGGRGRGGQGGSTIFGNRGRTGVNNDPNAQTDPKLRELNSQPSTPGPREAGLLHQDRHDPSRRDVHRRRSHGRHRLWRSRERRRLRDRFGDGAGADLQQPRRADRALDQVRALEQRGNRAERRPGVRRSAQGPPGQGRPARLQTLPRAEMARDDPARHDDVRPRDARTPTARSAPSSVRRPT